MPSPPNRHTVLAPPWLCRDGRLNYPPEGSDYKYLLELRSEAEFYGLTGLVRIIDRYPWGMVKVSRASSLNCDYRCVCVTG